MRGDVKMTAYELLEILKDHYKDDKILIEETNDLLEQIYNGHNCLSRQYSSSSCSN